MPSDDLKKRVAKAVLAYIAEPIILAVGTGTTINYFINELSTIKDLIIATIASSKATAKLLQQAGFNVIELPQAPALPLTLYIDSADAYNQYKQLVKGKGGALTQEKILAAASKNFICILDQSKPQNLSKVALPIEVIPMARSYVAHELIKLGGTPVLRQNFLTDNGNMILDVSNLQIDYPMELETKLNNIAGVIAHGLFAQRSADLLLVAGKHDIRSII